MVAENPNYLEARLLLASTLERLGSDTAATQELRTASEANPGSIRLRTQLAERLIRAGELAEADRILETSAGQVSLRRDVAPAERRKLAELLSMRNKPDRAAAVLDGIDGEAQTLETRIESARHKFRAGTLSAREASRLVEDARGSPGNLVSALEVVMIRAQANNDLTVATAARTELEALAAGEDLPAARANLVLGVEQMRAGDIVSAGQRFERLTVLDPADARGWGGRLAIALGQGNQEELRRLLTEAEFKVVEPALKLHLSKVIAQLSGRGTATFLTAEANAGREIFAALLPNPANGRPALTGETAIRDLTKAAQLAADRSDSARAQVASIAERYPDVPALQRERLQRLGEAGQWEEALRMGIVLIERFPTDVDVARLTTQAAEQRGQDTQARAFALTWLKLAQSPRQRLAASEALAKAYVAIGDPREAASVLKPFLPTLSAAEDIALIVPLYAEAAAASGDLSGAQAALVPYLTNGEVLRTFREIAINLPAPQARAWFAELDTFVERADNLLLSTYVGYARMQVAMRTGDEQLTQDAKARLPALADRVLASTDLPPESMLWMAVGMEWLDQPESLVKAETLYRRVLQNGSGATMAIAANNLAAMISRGGNSSGTSEEALTLANRAVAAAPNNELKARYLETSARILLQMNQPARAVTVMSEAVQLNGADADLRLTYAEALAANGDATAGEEQLDEAVRLNQRRRATDETAFQARLAAVRSSF